MHFWCCVPSRPLLIWKMGPHKMIRALCGPRKLQILYNADLDLTPIVTQWVKIILFIYQLELIFIYIWSLITHKLLPIFFTYHFFCYFYPLCYYCVAWLRSDYQLDYFLSTRKPAVASHQSITKGAKIQMERLEKQEWQLLDSL